MNPSPHRALASFASAFAASASLILSPLPAAAQLPLYTPRSVQKAYAKGTRTASGRPGPNYWQNHGRYIIAVSALPPDRTVRGSEQITYFNESPDTLSRLVIKLFLNIHKPGAPRLSGTSPDYLTDGVQIDSFAVNGHDAPWRADPRAFTWQPVQLPAPLLPHDSVQLSFAWHYEISREAGREGMLDSTTYYLAYFYPRVAVYDDYNGWDTMDFTDQQEFYSDFNDYDVTVRVPATYVVWGTGTLRDPSSLLQPDALRRYQASLTSDTVIRVGTATEIGAGRVTAQQAVNAWHFTSHDIPDVAFALSDHYDWDAASVVVDTVTHRRASVQAAYNDTAADFHHMVRFGQHALAWFSRNWPGVPYPYEKCTIVQGGADMEYPMMVNDGSTPDTSFSKLVADHEIAHTYMPFYMGINETRYGFMDEGWATTLEYLIGISDTGPQRAAEFFKRFRVTGWIHDPSPLEDLPIITPEDALIGAAYGDNAYGKSALGYLAMKDLLGDSLFARCLHAYMDRWHGKHPIPWDFFYTFDDVSGRRLDWFWRNWFFSNNYIDLALDRVRRARRGYAITIRNVGGMAAPVNVVMHYTDGSTDSVHETPAIWRANQSRATVTIATRKTASAVKLDGGIWMDANPADNQWSVK